MGSRSAPGTAPAWREVARLDRRGGEPGRRGRGGAGARARAPRGGRPGTGRGRPRTPRRPRPAPGTRARRSPTPSRSAGSACWRRSAPASDFGLGDLDRPLHVLQRGLAHVALQHMPGVLPDPEPIQRPLRRLRDGRRGTAADLDRGRWPGRWCTARLQRDHRDLSADRPGPRARLDVSQGTQCRGAFRPPKSPSPTLRASLARVDPVLAGATMGRCSRLFRGAPRKGPLDDVFGESGSSPDGGGAGLPGSGGAAQQCGPGARWSTCRVDAPGCSARSARKGKGP